MSKKNTLEDRPLYTVSGEVGYDGPAAFTIQEDERIDHNDNDLGKREIILQIGNNHKDCKDTALISTSEQLNKINTHDVTTRSYRTNSIPLSLKSGKHKHHSLDLVQLNGGSSRTDGDYHSPRRWMRQRAKRCCTRKILYKRLPILAWLPKYTRGDAVADCVAGLTVGLTVIPQAIAYANVAGLPAHYGLYSSYLACFIYAMFGSCRDSAVGPTAILAIITRENLHGLGPEFAVLLCFLSGCVEFLMGLLQLGFLIDFVSGPVSAGFTSAAAIIIATSQMKDVFGLSVANGSFINVWDSIFHHIAETRPWDAVLGLGSIIILLLLRKIKDLQVPGYRVISKLIWFVSTSRNITVVVISALIAYYFESNDEHPFRVIGHIQAGLPTFSTPLFETTVNNVTYNFPEMASNLGSGILVVPILAILENISIAKAFYDGKSIDATQEMLAIGLCNMASAFVSSMPITGSLSRGAVNHDSGVKTPFSGIYTGIIVIVSLYFFTPYFYFIPKASLAAVIIAAVVFMVEYQVVKPMWKTKKIDLIPAFATFFCSLFFRLELGMVVGISINLLFLLYASARPTVQVEKERSPVGTEYLRITPDRSLVFPSVEYVRNVVTKAGVRQGSSSIPVVLDCRHIQGVDFTAARGIKNLIEDFVKRQQPILFYNLKPSLIETFQSVKPTEFYYCNTEQNLLDLLKNYRHT